MSTTPTAAFRSNATRKLVVTGMLSAITIVLGMTPLGLIPLGPLKLTILHLPVILGAMIEGPVVGLILGAVFGGLSLYNAFAAPTILSPLFYNPLVSILPRMLIGPVSWLVYTGVKKLLKGMNWLPAGVAGFVGSMTNTVLVLGMIHILYAAEYTELLGQPASMAAALIWGAALTNGLPEAIAAAVILSPTERALSHLTSRRRTARKQPPKGNP